jgi:hypothetical protein
MGLEVMHLELSELPEKVLLGLVVTVNSLNTQTN